MDPLIAVLDHGSHRHGNRGADGMPTIDHGMLTQQHNLCIAHTHGIGFSDGSGGVQVLRAGVLLQFGGDFPSLPHLDFVAQDQPVQDVVEQRFGHAGGGDDATGVQRHVALLDAFRGQRAERRKVLGKPDGRHDFSQLHGGFHTQQPHVQRRGRIGLQRSADGAHLDRHLDAAAEVAFLIGPPLRERRVAVPASRIGVGTGFNGTPVVARSDGDGIDAVHDPLVVGGRPVRIHRRKVRRDNNSVANLFAGVVVASQCRVRNRAPRPGE